MENAKPRSSYNNVAPHDVPQAFQLEGLQQEIALGSILCSFSRHSLFKMVLRRVEAETSMMGDD